MKDPALILASGSPRRRELLKRTGLEYSVRPTDVDEEALEAAFTGTAKDLALYLAHHKAEAGIAAIVPGDQAVILAADTTVILDGQIFGKPHDADEAHAMLTRLRGHIHQVRTGIAIRATEMTETIEGALTTPVTMRDFSDSEMSAYIATDDPFDKAGSYAIQHPIFQPVAHIDGCATNVIGLPLCVVAPLLRRAGLTPQTPAHQNGTLCPWDGRCTQHPAEID